MLALRAASRPSPALRAPTRAASSEVLESEIAKIRQGFTEAGLNASTVSADKLKETFTARPDLVDAVTNVRKMMFQRNYSTSGLTYSTAKPPVRVTVTGASGAIGYAALFRIASGEMLGKDQPVILQLLELPGALKSLQGVAMELNDCAFPLLKGIVQTDNAEKAFEGAQYALLVGAKPRTKGMERADLLKGNAEIFKIQGKAINATADKNIKVVVVGNPANTNALITAHWAPSISPNNFSAMTRLDHNRALAQLSAKASAPVESIQKFAIWGNHSPTMYPDVTHATIGGKPLAGVINDQKWLQEVFIPVVQQRGTAIIEARGASSAASAAGSAIDHIRDWVHGTKGEWGSMGVISDGSYNTTPGLYFSFPLTTEGGKWKIVQGLKIDAFSEAKIAATNKELVAERDAVAAQLS